MRSGGGCGASGTHSLGQFCEQKPSFVPADAGIGDALAVDQLAAGNEFLRARDQIAFEHHADDAAISRGDLARDIAADSRLAGMVFTTVGVAAIDHDARGETGFFEQRGGFVDGGRVVVHGLAAAAQNDVAILIAGGEEDGGLAVFRVAEEGVRMAC